VPEQLQVAEERTLGAESANFPAVEYCQLWLTYLLEHEKELGWCSLCDPDTHSTEDFLEGSCSAHIVFNVAIRILPTLFFRSPCYNIATIAEFF